MSNSSELYRADEVLHAESVLGTDDAVAITRYLRAARLWAWHDGSDLDLRKPARRKLKRAHRIFRMIAVAR